MVRLKVKTSSNAKPVPISGNCILNRAGYVSTVATGNDNRVVLSDTRPSYERWYADIIDAKASAMLLGGDLGDTFRGAGLAAKVTAEDALWLTSINGTTPSTSRGDNAIYLIPGKYVDVENDINNHRVKLTLSPAYFNPYSLYKEIYIFLIRLYKTMNNFRDRLMVPDINRIVEGYKVPNEYSDKLVPRHFGPYLGTWKQYQAVVARWNHYAWVNSMMIKVTSMNERASVVVGYTATECLKLPVKIVCDIKLLDGKGGTVVTKPEQFPTVEGSRPLLTLFKQGIDTDVTSRDITPTTVLGIKGAAVTKDAGSDEYTYDIPEDYTEISGNGYNDAAGALVAAKITVTLDSESETSLPVESYYIEAFALAYANGTKFTYTPQKESDVRDTGKYYYKVTTTWYSGNAIIGTKTDDLEVCAVNVKEPQTPEDSEESK